MYPVSINKIEEVLKKNTLVDKIIRFTTMNKSETIQLGIVQAKIVGMHFELPTETSENEKYLTIYLSTGNCINMRILANNKVCVDYQYHKVQLESIEILTQVRYGDPYMCFKQMFVNN